MRILTHRYTETITEHYRSFRIHHASLPGCGYEFDCDEHGNIDIGKLKPAALANYHDCLKGKQIRLINAKYELGNNHEYQRVANTGTYVECPIKDMGIRTQTYSHSHPAEGECECGETVILDRFTNACDCGRDYNMSGQLLADRSCWGEECGETANDVLMADRFFQNKITY